jgi:hypothetical protein
MSAQVRSYRWSDKPVAAKQTIVTVLLTILVAILILRFRSKIRSKSEVHAFTQSKQNHSQGQTLDAIKSSGSVPPGKLVKGVRAQATGNNSSSNQHAPTIQVRPLFDGMTATLLGSISQAISSNSGDSSVMAIVVGLLPGDVSEGDAEGIEGATLHGQFVSNFETKKVQIQFRDLVTPDGRTYAVSGVALDMDGKSIGVPADYSSGIGYRLLGATLGTVISTAEIAATSRVIENEAGQEALMSSQLNQAITTSSQGATTTISDEATRDLKNHKATLSLPAGTQFQVKLKQSAQGSQGGGT